MKSNAILLLATFTPAILTVAAKVYLVGDGTMARGGAGHGTEGWGEFLHRYLSVSVVNKAGPGESARSFTDEGHFHDLINTVEKGDFVVLQFGRNDRWLGPNDNGRQDAPGLDYLTNASVIHPIGHKITFHTFGYYIQNAVDRLKEKGAIAIVTSRTPDDQWSKGSIVPAGQSEFVEYARISARCTNVAYVNHYGYVAQALDKLGQTTVNKTKLFPYDLSHTSPAGAEMVAKAFVRGLLCGSSSLKNKVNSRGHAVHHHGCLHETSVWPVNTNYCLPKSHA